MKHIPADFTRMIDLPGVGLCARPVDIDQAVTGFSRLVSMRVYAFEPGPAINGEAEDDEVYIVLLSGAAQIEVTGAENAAFALTEKGTRAVYLPVGHHYRLTPQARTEIAYMRAKPRGAKSPAGFAAGALPQLLPDPGYADRLSVRLVEIGADRPLALDNAASERLVLSLGAVNGPAGAVEEWSTLALSPGEGASITAGNRTVLLIASA